MITLKISKSGHFVSIPGLPVFRTPAEVDISKIDIRIVHMYLVTAGIDEYEIVAENKHGEKEVYKKDDFENKNSNKNIQKDRNLDTRLENLEVMLAALLEKESGDNSTDKEQITNKLTNLENITAKILEERETTGVYIPEKDKEPKIEELDSFIPDIDISDMKIKSKIKTLKKDGSVISDAADILSNLVKKGKKDD